MTLTKQQIGGRATAIKLRKEALDRYYKNPNVCLECEKIIMVADNQHVIDARIKKFCCLKCAGSYHARERYKNYVYKVKKKVVRYCPCGNELIGKKKWCINCLPVNNMTKKELFNKRKNWQSARTAIRQSADLIYKYNNGKYECLLCGYTKHVELCHIKQVKDFNDNTLIKEINAFDNLVALCPTHHWEFDNNELSMEHKEKIKIHVDLKNSKDVV